GTQSLHTNSRDEALSLPTEDSVRIALRTQQVIAHESGAVNTLDPLGGSYFVEALTLQIEQQAMDYINKIEGMGGMLHAIDQGWVQREIHDSAYTYQKEIEADDRVIVGVNDYKIDEPTNVDILKVPPELEHKQLGKLTTLKKERDGAKVQESLETIRKTAQGDANLMPVIVEAVKAYATLGEICNVFRDEFGVYRAPDIF
ncbi:MAG: methylmalonyl-CoA mutase, partial [Thermoplasmata archaeon]|nr:methylmalonyl-CoA mutase [Thermoplasmata archaeon]